MTTSELGPIGAALQALGEKFPGEEVAIWTILTADGKIGFTGYAGGRETATYSGSFAEHPDEVFKYLSENHSSENILQKRLRQLENEKAEIESQMLKLKVA